MNPILAVVIFVASFVVAWIGVGLFRRWSLRREIFDVPNERSSHTEPTPRGGGVVIVAVTLAGYLLSTLLTDLPISYGYLAGAVMISLISWLDDLLSLPFWARLAGATHATRVLSWSGGCSAVCPLSGIAPMHKLQRNLIFM